MVKTRKDTNFIQSVLFLFLAEVEHLDLLERVDPVVLSAPHFVDRRVGAVTCTESASSKVPSQIMSCLTAPTRPPRNSLSRLNNLKICPYHHSEDSSRRIGKGCDQCYLPNFLII